MGDAARLRDDSGYPERTYAIGELADEFGLTLRSIRHYEDEGLLSPGREGTVRVYDRRDRARLALICRGKRLGFSLTEIKEFLSLYDTDGAQVGQMRYLRRMARERIAALRRQLADVQQTLTELTDIDDQITRHLRRQGADDATNEEGSRS
ncbi:MerR family DNA-binding transcriptional regulator [Azospirillum sp. RWY-5-1]|uniref:MerR family DNA-binding transcriptional regulator n=1 Tax=Azospirillum oleiclasticum TaxID=2735135 RepID=A0ABX2TDB8_9PROT|nr:MerR family DNA-binding transcriptional regulator [Azospirillum oleiclasticum]NYZ14305.1 MerR family DNA-binding transcriptional regulator [Azospirillum oleiclasticum]NYZ21790.1 MerR family DNA-binding transcriptional regulator [Azospirillum oleiclasticum]